MAKTDRRFKYESEADKPVMLSVRVPRELNDRLERYASEHRQKVSELVRDAIEMRLEMEVDPWSRRSGSTADATEIQIDGASLLRDMQATLARHDTQMHAIMQAIERPIERQTTAEPMSAMDILRDETLWSQVVQADKTRLRQVVQATVVQAAQNPALARGEDPSFDTSKFYLGKLCPQAHDFSDTGMSLLRTHNQRCRECENATKRERRKATRQVRA